MFARISLFGDPQICTASVATVDLVACSELPELKFPKTLDLLVTFSVSLAERILDQIR